MKNKSLWNRSKGVVSNILIIIALIGACLYALIPLYFMTITALKTQSEFVYNLWGWPSNIVLSNITDVLFNHGFLLFLRNSFVVTSSSVIIGTFLASLAGYAFAKKQFILKNFLFTLNVALISVPIIVMVVPLFSFIARLGFINTFPSVILIYTGMIIPMSIYLLTRFFENIPNELIDAARIDGCSDLRIFISILLPLVKPAIFTAFMINTLWVWNDLLVALIFLQEESMWTLMVGAATFQGRFDLNVPLLMAALLIITLPLVILYILGHRYFIRGLIEGSIK